MKYSRQHRPLTGNLQGLSLRITQVSGPFPGKNVQTRSLPAVSPKFGSPTAGPCPALPPCRWKVTQNTTQFTRIPVIPDCEITGKLAYSGANCRELITTRRIAGQHAAPDKPQGQYVTAQLVPDYWMLRELRHVRGLCDGGTVPYGPCTPTSQASAKSLTLMRSPITATCSRLAGTSEQKKPQMMTICHSTNAWSNSPQN